MDILQQAIIEAGNKVHEDIYQATMNWQGTDYPCSHDSIFRNPVMVFGGVSPDTQGTVTVRLSLFDANADGTPNVPAKGNNVTLTVAPGFVYDMRVEQSAISVGASLLTMVCKDINQRV